MDGVVALDVLTREMTSSNVGVARPNGRRRGEGLHFAKGTRGRSSRTPVWPTSTTPAPLHGPAQPSWPPPQRCRTLRLRPASVKVPERSAPPRSLAGCRSAPSTPTSISLTWKSASCAGGGPTTCRRRPGPCAAAPSPGSSTRARRPPTGAPASTTCGRGRSRTSIPGSRRCGAETSPARADGTATASRSSSRWRRELGLSTKHQIEAFGIEEFNRRCRESVQRYVADWEALTERAGVWIDTTDAYWTLDNTYIESVWWLVRQLWDKGLLYEGHKVSPYCGRCGTALSSTSSGQPDVYRDVVDPSVYVRFPLVDDDADLMVWTTTPWTLHLEHRRRRRRRHRLRPGPRPRRRTRSRHGRRPCPRGRRGRRPPHAGPTSSAVATSGPSTSSTRPSGAPTDGGWWPPTSSPPTTGRASCTWPPRSARTTPGSAGSRGSRCSTPWTPTAAFDDSVPAYAHRFVKDADRGDHRRPRRSGAAGASSSPTSTPTRTAGGAAPR